MRSFVLLKGEWWVFKNQKARWMAPEEQHLQLLLVPTCTRTPHVCIHRMKRQGTHGRKSLQNTLLIVVLWKKILKLKNTKTTKWKDLNWQLIRRVVLAIRHPGMLRAISPGELHCKTAGCSLHLSDADQNRKQQELLLLGVKMRIHYPAELELMLLLTMWSNCGVPDCLSQRNCQTEMWMPCL